MHMNPISPKILFIRGAFMRDCLAEQALDHESKTDSFQEYDELPTVFHNVWDWKPSTNLRCWHCDLTFESTPIFVPKIIEPKDGGVVMITEGNFCSFHCAVSHVNLVCPNVNDNIEAKNKLKYLYSVMNGRTVREIEPMPSRYLMKYYGGHLTAAQYRELGRNLRNTY